MSTHVTLERAELEGNPEDRPTLLIGTYTVDFTWVYFGNFEVQVSFRNRLLKYLNQIYGIIERTR